jgi:hypothetical protein
MMTMNPLFSTEAAHGNEYREKTVWPVFVVLEIPLHHQGESCWPCLKNGFIPRHHHNTAAIFWAVQIHLPGHAVETGQKMAGGKKLPAAVFENIAKIYVERTENNSCRDYNQHHQPKRLNFPIFRDAEIVTVHREA